MKLYQFLVVLMTFIGFSFVSFANAQQTNLVLQTEPIETTIPLTGSVQIASDGSLKAVPASPTTACQVSNTCEGVTVQILSFSGTQASNDTIQVEEGESLTLNWKSLGATGCRGGGTFPIWANRTGLAADSSDAEASELTIATAVGDAANSPYELKLSCSNGSVVSDDTSVSTLSLVIDQFVAPSPTSCEGRQPLAGWQALETGSLSCHFASGVVTTSDCRDWVSVWQGTFLESGGKPRTLMSNVSAAKQYVAMKFRTEGMSQTASGQLSAEGPASGVLAEPILATISRCPGDFNPEQTTGCYLKPGSTAQLTWRAPQSTRPTSCVLEPNTDYYLNLVSTLSKEGTLPENIQENSVCADSRCGIQLTPRFNN